MVPGKSWNLVETRAREESHWGEAAKSLEGYRTERLGIPRNEVCLPHKCPRALRCCLRIFPVHFTPREECSLNQPCSSSARKCVWCERNPHLVPDHLFSHPDSITCQVPLHPYAAQRWVYLLLQLNSYILQDRIKQNSLTPLCPDLHLPTEKPIWLICLHKKRE